MLQVKDNKEASCVFYIKVGTLTHLEQSKISLETFNKTGIVRLTVKHVFIISVSFMYYPREYLKQTSGAILSREPRPMYI
jgi:hypothetical protein